jgi:MFS transporter, DHA3 family, macrolide efflux protein
VGLLAIALGSEWPAAFVVILTTLIGFGSSILGPALSASIPTLGGGAQIQQLNALVNSTWQTAGLVTPILAGVLTSFWGATNVLFVDAASFVVAAILYVRIRFPDAQTAESTSNSAVTIRSWLSDVRVGVGYFAKRRVLWGSIMGVTSMNAGFAAMFLVFPRVVGRFVVNVDWLDTFGSDAGAIGFGFFETVTISLEIVASILIGSTGRIFATWATGLLLAAESTTTTTTLVFGVLIILTIVGFGVASSAVDGEDQQVLASVGS